MINQYKSLGDNEIFPTPTPTNNVVIISNGPYPTPTPTRARPVPTPNNKQLPTNLQCATDIFNVISPEFHNTFNTAINTLLHSSGLSVPCILRFSSPVQNDKLCINCVYNHNTNSSANLYLVGGPRPFPDGSVCPVCVGRGFTIADSYEEHVNMMVLFDSKYFMNWSNQAVAIPNNMAQTISCIELYPKIKNTYEAVLNSDLSDISSQVYERTGDPQPMGLGETKYILTTWKKK